MTENQAAPRSIDNPDAAEFTKRHSEFYSWWVKKDEERSRIAFKALRSWAWARCKKDVEFTKRYEELVQDKKPLGLNAMDELATAMKEVWHDQGLWDYGRIPEAEAALLE